MLYMEATTTSETTFRAVFRHENDMGSSFGPIRVELDRAWEDVDDIDHPDSGGLWQRGEWAVQQTTITTTTKDVTR